MKSLTVAVATFNILCADCNPYVTNPPWEERKQHIVNRIIEGNADVIGLQEVTDGEPLQFILYNLTGYNYCISPIDNSGARTVLLAKHHLAMACQTPIPIADNRNCNHGIIDGWNYYNCHFPLTEPLNTLSTTIFLGEVKEPFIFMGDFNTHSEGYPHNDARLMQYSQTREKGSRSFWNIDRIGISEQHYKIEFSRDALSPMSDHPYLQASLSSYEWFYPLIPHLLE